MDIANYCASLDPLSLTESSFSNALGGNWYTLTFLGLIGMVFFVSLIYFFSQATRNHKMEAWARFELFQIFATATIAILIAGWLYGMCHWDATFLYGPTTQLSTELVEESKELCNMQGYSEFTPYCSAQAFLTKVKNRGDTVMQSLIGINYLLSYLFKSTWNSSPMGIGFTVEPLSGFNQVMNIFLVAVSGFIMSYLAVLVQMRLLDFIFVSIPYYFLPLGLLLRSFSPTREFGGAIIGFSIASLFFYPLLLVVNDAVLFSPIDAFIDDTTRAVDLSTLKYADYDKYVDKTQLDLQTNLNSNSDLRVNANEVANQFVQYENTGVDGSGRVNMTTKNVAQASKYFTQLDPTKHDNLFSKKTWELGNAISYPYQLVFIYSIAAVVFPLINFLVYIEIARELTQFFGTQVDLTNLTRLI